MPVISPVRQWFITNRRWRGPRALAPVDICYKVLDLLAWVVTLSNFSLVSTSYQARGTELIWDWSFWILLISTLLPLTAVIFRSLPFSVRFSLITVVLAEVIVFGVMEVGLPPNISLFITILLASISLFYGLRVGLVTMSLCALVLVLGAWGWTHDLLPLSMSPSQSAGWMYDFRSPYVWIRVLPIMVLQISALLFFLHLALSRLKSNLSETQSTLRQLGFEQEQRARAEIERSEKEKQLRASELKFRSLFENANDAIFLMDGKVFTSCNRRTEDMFGCPSEQIIGQSPLDFSPPLQPDGRSSADAARQYIQAALAGQSQNFEWQHRKLDGTPFDTDVGLDRVEIAGKVFLQAIVRDISERKRAEVIVTESASFRKRVFESSPVPIVVLDATTTTIIDCNRAAIEIYRQPSREAFLGLSVADVSPPTQYDGTLSTTLVREYIQRASNEKEVVFEWQHQRAGGELWDAEIHLMRFEAGGRQLLQFTLQDITDRKRTEQALRQSEERYRQIAACVPDLIWTMDLSGSFTYANPAAERTHGWTVDELTQITFRESNTPEQAAINEATLTHELEQARQPGYDRHRIIRFESHERRKDGSTFWADVSAALIWGADEQPVGLVGVTRDVSERKRAEAERETLQSQLIQSQKMEAVGQLAGGVAHDFNNILTAILLYVDILHEESDLPESVTDALEEMGEAANRAVNLTRQLLMFSRRQVVQKELLDVDVLIGNLLNMLRRLIGENIAINFMRGQRPSWSVADSGMLEQVIVNLVVNARDAMPQGGQITLRTECTTLTASDARAHPESGSGEYIVLTVSDTGCGMSTETQKHVFEPFFSTKEKGKGTGLGLATVYGIVKQHNGWIELESAEKQGTTFRIFLPAADVPMESNATAGGPSALLGGHEVILLVEDDAAVRKLTTSVLEQVGYTIFTANNGPEAGKIWEDRKDTIDLLLTDMIMPEGLTGLDLTRRFRQQKPDLKVVIMSGYSLELNQRGALSDDHLAYLAKPFEVQKLTDLVRHTLDS